MKKEITPFYMGGGIESNTIDFDLQRFATVDNPYIDELEEDLEVSSKIDSSSSYLFNFTDISISGTMEIPLGKNKVNIILTAATGTSTNTLTIDNSITSYTFSATYTGYSVYVTLNEIGITFSNVRNPSIIEFDFYTN